jgi:hypothetical protein
MIFDNAKKGTAKYIFQPKGGYVALAKTYRRYLQEHDAYKSLAEKARENPDVAKVRGAAVFRISANAGEADRIIQVVDDLHASGVKRAIIETDPSCRLGKQQIEQIQKHGYLVNVTSAENFFDFGLAHREQVPVNGIAWGDTQFSAWHWNHANNREPDSWLKKDLINILYGTAPTYVVDAAGYWTNKQDILKSYNRVCPWYERLFGGAVMNHRWLTEDRNVQETEFSNGWTAIVNFGDSPYKTSRGTVLQPVSYTVFNHVM